MRFPAAFSFLAICASLCAQSAPQYTVTNLGVLSSPDLLVSQATGINNGGVIIGFSATEAFPMFAGEFNSLHSARGWMYVSGTLTDLDSADTSQLTVPLAINDNNEMTVLRGPETGATAYIYQNGVYTLPSTFPGNSLPVGLNTSGEISGTRFVSSEPFAFTWNANTLSTLPIGNGVTGSLGFGLSSNGIVAGALAGGPTDVFAATWASGASPALFTATDNSLGESVAFAVNSAGTGAGLIFDGGFTTEAAIFSGGSATGIGGYPGALGSMATGINESGVVVGFSVPAGIDSSKFYQKYFDPAALLPPQSTGRAFVYIDGTLYDLTALIGDARWVFSYASGINDAGQIVGTGFYNGAQTAFLLTPQGGADIPVIGAAVGAGLSSPSVTTLSPGGLFTVFGTSLSSSTTPVSVDSATLVNGALPTNLGGSCVTVNGTPAPLTYVSATQINAEGPQLTNNGFVSIVVTANCGDDNEIASVPVSVGFAPQSPEFLYWASSQVVAVQYPSGAYIASPGLIPGLTTIPAEPGDILILYPIGLGATTPAVPPGLLAGGAYELSGQVGVTIGGVEAQVLYAGVAPGYSGLYQINLTVPAGLGTAGTTTLLPIVVTVNGVPSPATGMLAISN
jgi:uncharacterized protein (TIGR03437 family)